MSDFQEPRKQPGRPRKIVPDAKPEEGDDRPQIRLTADEHLAVGETALAMGRDESLYQRGGELVRTRRVHDPNSDGLVKRYGTSVIEALPLADLRSRITRHAFLTKRNEKGRVVQAHPNDWLVKGVNSLGNWSTVRHLAAISDAPVLRSDGTIWQTRGYDSRTSVLYDPPPDAPPLNLPAKPTMANAQAAAERLMEVTADFPFEQPAHFTAWLASLLTPLARFCFSGPAPLFLMDANVQGSGKTKLVHLVGRIVFGCDMPVSPYLSKNEEMAKVITGVALSGDRTVLLDNISGVFGNSALEAVLTSTVYQGRVLGKNERPKIPMNTVWYATGNNLALTSDMARRTLPVRILTLDENPEARTNFKHADLIAWVTENRMSLLSDAMTILSGFLRAGRPVNPSPAFGSFEAWSAVIRGAIVWLGLPDPYTTREAMCQSQDRDLERLIQFMDAWENYVGIDNNRRDGMVIAEIVQELYPPSRSDWSRDPACVQMRTALEAVGRASPGKSPAADAIGYWLRGIVGRVHRDRFFNRVKKTNNHRGAIWKLYRVGELPEPKAG